MLLSHRRLLRELRAEVLSLQERVDAQDGAISTLSHALVHGTAPTPEVGGAELKSPVRIGRKGFLQLQREYEFGHNRPARELADKIKYGML